MARPPAPRPKGVVVENPGFCYHTDMNDSHSEDEVPVYFTAGHLLQALQALDPSLLGYPLVLVHGKDLNKPNLVQGLIPSPTPVDRSTVESKPPSLLTLGALTDLTKDSSKNGGR